MKLFKLIFIFILLEILAFSCTKQSTSNPDIKKLDNSNYGDYIKNNVVLKLDDTEEDINKRINGYTPLQYLVKYQLTAKDIDEQESFKVLESFLENGAILDNLFEPKYRAGFDVIGVCIRDRYNFYLINLLKYMTHKLPDIGENGLNYLHLAIVYRNFPIVRFLLPYIENINGVNEKNQTALFYAAASDANEDVIQLLLDNGADKTIVDINGNSACDIYTKYFSRYDGIYQLLEY